MNHFSYELMAKEKIKDLQAEGMRSQAVYGSGAAKLSLLPSWPKLLLGLLGILGLLAMFGR